MPKIIIEITAPEDYEDVHPELILEDFLESPKAFDVRLVAHNCKKNDDKL